MEDFKIFENVEFGELHILDNNGELWFIGKEIASKLEYKDTDKAIRNHVDDEDKQTRQIGGWGGSAQEQTRRMILINESGFYSLVLSSKLPAAKRFKRWVTSEVIPSIRKTGSYALTKPAVLPLPSPADLPSPSIVEKVSRPLSPTACVYALLMSNGTVKIGHSGNVKKRVSCIESKHGLTVEKIYHTPFISREIARLIEKACHNIFSPSKVDGEFFSIKFESACAEIDTFVKFVEALPLVSNFERGKVLVELAISLKDSQTKEYIAINATNLIVGQCSA